MLGWDQGVFLKGLMDLSLPFEEWLEENPEQ